MTPTAPPYDPDRDVEDFVVTESTFDKTEDLNKLKGFLKETKTTGKLTLDLNQGGICRIHLSEKSAKASFDAEERSAGERP